MDYIDTTKVQVKWMRKIRVVQRGQGSTIAVDAEGKIRYAEDGPDDGTGGVYAGLDKTVMTAPNVIKKFYIPFNHKMEYPDYNDGADTSSVPLRPNDWQLVLWAWDSTLTPTDQTASVDQQVGNYSCTTKFYFNDL